MSERRSLELAFEDFLEELQPFLPKDPERLRALERIVAISHDLYELQEGLSQDPFLKDAGRRYFGLDPLKISALNIAYGLEADELRYLRLCLRLSHELILANILRLRVAPGSSPKLQAHFSAQELQHYPAAHEMMAKLEAELREEQEDMRREIADLRSEYELYLFVESSHEASRSFGAASPNIRAHHSSWVAFAQFLTSLSVHVHEAEKMALIRKCQRIDVRREAIFENCAELFAKAAIGKDAKKIQRQLSSNLEEIKILEAEIESTLSALSVPGLHDYASFIMKKTPEGGTTFELNNLSQSTGDKT